MDRMDDGRAAGGGREREGGREGGREATTRPWPPTDRPAELLMRGCRAAQVALLSALSVLSRPLPRPRRLSNTVDTI